MARFVVGVTGASGIILAHRLVSALTSLEHDVELIMTRDSHLTALEEVGEEFATPKRFINSFAEEQQNRIHHHAITDFSSRIASGSFLTDGMIVIPCSMASLAAIATGLSDNLLRRAADVTLKERRPLVIVPRESPFNEIHLEHMLKLTRMGVTIVPPIPAWYTQPKSVADIENFIVGKTLDALKLPHALYPRWTGIEKVSCESTH